MAKLLTPLTIGTTLVVMALGIARLLLMPDAWVSSLAALLFFPLVLGGVLLKHGSGYRRLGAVKVAGKLRDGLVGAGVLLASALAESMIETLGLMPGRAGGVGGTLVVALPAVVAIGIDIFSARLERRAEKEQD